MSNRIPTRQQVQAGIEMVVAVGRAIQAKGTVPAGELYAVVMGKLTLDEFQLLLTKLEDARLIRYDRNHLITWTGTR